MWLPWRGKGHRDNLLDDKLIDDVIDDDLYQRKKADLLIDRQRWQNTLVNQAKKAARLTNVSKFLELVKNLCVLYVSAAAVQKREIVKFATSNREVFGKKIVIEPPEWLEAFRSLMNLDFCDLDRPTYRTFGPLLERANDEEYLDLLENLKNTPQTDEQIENIGWMIQNDDARSRKNQL